MQVYGIIVRDDNISLNVEATSKKIASLIDKSGYTDKELSQKLNISIQAIIRRLRNGSTPISAARLGITVRMR